MKKFAADRPLADPDAAARKIVEIANQGQPHVQSRAATCAQSVARAFKRVPKFLSASANLRSHQDAKLHRPRVEVKR